jgi:hypothetical protein
VDANQEMAVVDLIRSGCASGNYVTQRNVLPFVEREFRKYLIYSWIRSFLARNDDAVEAITIAPQEKVRLEIPRQFLDGQIKLVKEYVAFIPSELIFNIDECGFSDLEECEDRPAIIPAKARASTLHYLVNRQISRQSLICRVTVGDAYCPFPVSSDPSVMSIFELGARERIDLGVEISPSPYVSQTFLKIC